MNETTIRAALESRLAAWAAARPVPVAWENVAFTPTTGEAYLRAFLLPAATVSGSFCSEQFKGIFQINVLAPADGGPGAGAALARAVADLFPAGANIGGVRVPMPPAVGAGRDDANGFYMIPVSVRYQAD